MKRNIIALTLLFFFVTQPIDLKLTKRQLCDLELIMNGGFAPLEGFMTEADYNSCVENMRLTDGSVWPMPICLDVPKKLYDQLPVGSQLELKDENGKLLAVLEVSDKWKPDKKKEAQHVFKADGDDHPAVYYLYHQTQDYYVGGKVTQVAMPDHYDFPELRRTPAELKGYFRKHGITKVVAFQTRNPMHFAHYELTRRAAEEVGAHLLIQPAVGSTKPGDVDHFTRVKCYKKLIQRYPEGTATLSLYPISMRMGGPREALWHALIRKNYGATHFIVGRDHAGPGKDRNGNDFYGIYDSQNLVRKYEDEIGIKVVPFKEMCYVVEESAYMPKDKVPSTATILAISGTQFRKMLREGKNVPSWFSPSEIIKQLRKNYVPKNKQGFTLFFTGLSGAGKSTIAQALAMRLEAIQDRPITMLDGDEVRKFLSYGLGFSKEDRSMNVRRVGFVASEVTKNRGIAICPMIAPYEEDRQANRELISQRGGFIEIYLSTPLDVCQERDPKGLYQKAKEGEIKNFTGIDDPYEAPKNPELVINTHDRSIDEVLDEIVSYLYQAGYLRLEGSRDDSALSIFELKRGFLKT